MCEPTTIAYGIAAVLAVGAGVYSADAAKKQGRYNQQVAELNADVADRQATDATRRGEAEAAERRLKTRLAIGQQRAALAGNGVDLSMGTPLDILGDEAMFGAIDEDRIRANAAREAWGYRVEAQNLRAGGTMARYTGDTTAKATYLSTAAQAFSMGAGMGGGASGGGYGGGSTFGKVKTSGNKKGWG